MLNNSMNLSYSKERRRRKKKKRMYIYIYIYVKFDSYNKWKDEDQNHKCLCKNHQKVSIVYAAFGPKRHLRAFKIILSILIIQKATFFFLVVDTKFSIDSHTPRCHEKLCLDLYARLTQMLSICQLCSN